jgi:hypothetical protein
MSGLAGSAVTESFGPLADRGILDSRAKPDNYSWNDPIPDHLQISTLDNSMQNNDYYNLKRIHNVTENKGLYRTKEFLEAHQLDYVYTGPNILKDHQSHLNQYHKMMYGVTDNIEADFKHHAMESMPSRDIQEAPFMRENTLENMNPEDFVPVGTITRQELLNSFSEARAHYKNEVDTDAEWAMKMAFNPDLYVSQYHGRNNPTLRKHKILGTHGLTRLFREENGDAKIIKESLVSGNIMDRWGAPDGDGAVVPRDVRLAFPDPREKEITFETHNKVLKDPLADFNGLKLDHFKSKDLERLQTLDVSKDPLAAGLIGHYGNNMRTKLVT